ncbi:MAG TPA: 3-deoxy-manno-octulosonate cytidylyltransferase [bacterium]|jgi:3-deoxy-manno-octulosonate cytidylyltransferase (CMP-KDO synthetase)|nr:3-deoxy-manno-octulosonate cytidylyltransferase [bacterium]
MASKVIGVIPSRYGAQRFPGKPLALIAGVPMIVRVVRQAQKAKRLSEVWVATDDRRIAEAVEKAGATAVMTPSSLKSGTDRIAYSVRNQRADIIVNIQGDEPVMAPAAIDAAVEVLQKDQKVLMSTVVIPLADRKEWLDPNVVKAVLGFKGDVLYFSRAPIPYPREGGVPKAYKHMGLYGYRPAWLQLMATMRPTPLELTEKLEQLRAMENGVVIRAAVRKVESIAVDVPADVKKVEKYLKKRK